MFESISAQFLLPFVHNMLTFISVCLNRTVFSENHETRKWFKRITCQSKTWQDYRGL